MNLGQIFYKKKKVVQPPQNQNFLSSSKILNIQNNTLQKNPPVENPGNLVQISNFFNVTNNPLKKKEYKQEKTRPELSFLFNNIPHTSFIPHRQKNELDDLQELLNSKKVQKTLNSSVLKNFIDKNFKPCEKTILGYHSPKAINTSKMTFLRPSEFFKPPILVCEKIDPDDIYQGSLGDCYLLAAISSIANAPHRIKRLFLIKNYNKNGVYIVALCINGIWQEIIMDDYFVCDKNTKKPSFNYNKNNELWVMLLEKAWAKVHGGYMNISSGITREALRDLTGAPAKTFFTDSVDSGKFWERLLESYERNFVMTGGSDDLSYGKGDVFVSKIGLAGSHAYAILGVYEIGEDNGALRRVFGYERKDFYRVERVLKLRNPWGRGEWKGDWGDGDPRWTKRLRLEFGMEVREDGIFFMGYDSYLKFFSDTQICYFYDRYKYSAVSLLTGPLEETFLRFEINKPGKYYLSLNQKNRRFFRKEAKYRYSFLSMLIIKENNGDYEYINYGIKKDKENWVECNLKNGIYYAFISTPWQSCVNEFSFSVYGPSISKIKKLKKNEKPNNIIQLTFRNHAIKNKSESSKLQKTDCQIKKWHNNKGLGYLYFKNDSQNNEIDITVEMESQNVDFYRYNSQKPNFVINPKKDKILIFLPTRLPTLSKMRILSCEKKFDGKKKNRKKIEEKAFKILRKFEGRDIGVFLYVLKTDDFMIYQYINESSRFYLQEHVCFEFLNCFINGIRGNSVDFVLEPLDERMILIQKIESHKPFKVKIKNSRYKINS